MDDLDSAVSQGLVGVIAQDQARFTVFASSLTGLAVPPGTRIEWQVGHSIAANTNALVRATLAHPENEWLWILGDDHAFGHDALLRLLARRVDVVAPLCLTRTPPYKPVAFSGFAGGDGHRRRIDLSGDPEGLLPVHSMGSAGMLVRRRVLEALADPWFEAGRASSVEIGEDVYFCDKAREAGFSLFTDLDVPLGHCTTSTVWPARTPDGWSYAFTMAGGMRLTLPAGSWLAADEAARAAA